LRNFKVYVSDYDYPDLAIERDILEPIGADVIGLQCNDGAGLAEQAADADAILQQYAKIDRDTISKLKKCKVICRYGSGADILDIGAAYEHGILVTNVPDYCLDEVADHNLAMGLMLIRRIPMYDKATKAGRWHWSESGGPIYRFREMTWGLIGYGRIPQNLARKVQALGFTLQAYDPFVSGDFMFSTGARKVELDVLVSTSDVVSVMCPFTQETFHIIDERVLRMMRPHTVLLNCTRGKLVDNKALYRALTEGWIASAGLDDPEEEPAKLKHWSPASNPLFSLDNCVITPHAAYVSERSLKECRRVAAENAKAVLLGQPPPNPLKR
jgi:D-3-phosphoglycerate dehydrogenase